MPLTPNGKVNRQALPAPDRSSSIELETNFVPPSNPTEEILVTIWADVLGMERIGVHDNFFDLGGHSLLATRVISKLNQSFSVELSLRHIFETPTVAGLVVTVTQLKFKNKNTRKYQTISPREKRDSLPLSFAQQRLWFLDLLEPNSPFYNIPEAVRLQGDLNIQVLQQALDAIVAHHEILRTNYVTENGNPIQRLAASQSVELLIVDLQHYGQAEQETQIQRLLQQESQRPFSLASDMMLRGCLLQLAPQEHVLLLVMHHIASDAWSMGILWEQLTQLYQAFLDRQPNPLETLPIQYADYAVWQREWLSGEVLDQQLSYWKKQLTGAKPLLELPTDRSRPPIQTYRGASQSVVIPETLTKSLKQLSCQEGVTLYMTLLAAFQTLLYRYSRQEDIIVGSPIAGRTRTELEGLIGFFVNTLVLRTDLSGNPSFLQLLEQVRSITLDAYAHQDLPFEKLVEELSPERSLSYNPLFQVMFDLQNASGQAGQLLGLTQTPVQLEVEAAKFDLTLSVIEKDGVFVGSWKYNTDLFDAATITRMTGHFQTLLEGIVANPQQSISQLPLLAAPERQQLLVKCNDTATEYPQAQCIHQLFEEQVEQTPDEVAVVFENQPLTYRELNERANQLAHHLQSLGVKPETFVGVCVERSLEMVIALLGILKAGGAYLPLDPSYPQQRLVYMLEDSQALVLVTEQSLNLERSQSEIEVVYLDSEAESIARQSTCNSTSGVTSSNLAYVIYTSGSTGKPKGVPIEHRNAVNLLTSIERQPGLSDRDVLLSVTTISFDISVLEIFLPLIVGARLVIVTREVAADGIKLQQALESYEATVMQATPVTWQLLVAVGGAKRPLKMLSGGEALSKQLAEKLLETASSLWNVYGPTETTIWSSVHRVEAEENPISIGKPLANTQFYILDSELQPVPIGVPGELYIGGDGLSRGYLNRPELTETKFIPHPFKGEQGVKIYKTGDLARYLPNGEVICLGRSDNQVKLRGFRIELGEIEAVLSQNPAVGQSVVITREDSPGDKRLVAYVVPQQEPPHSSELRSFVQERLPNYMVPSTFVFLETMPLTPNGKVNRQALPTPVFQQQQSAESLIKPRNKLEIKLTQIWQAVLGIESISINDNFFDLGGHSLLAVKLFGLIEQEFGKKVPLTTIFEAPTIEQLAKILQPSEELKSFDSLVLLKPGNSKVPLFLIHDADGEIILYLNLARHLHSERPVYGLKPYSKKGYPMLHTRISEIVEHYIKEIRSVQPKGPYLIGGLCAGGVLAFEVACQLQAQGETVPFVAIIDAVDVKEPSQANYINHNRMSRFLQTFSKGQQIKSKKWLAYILKTSIKKVNNLILYEASTKNKNIEAILKFRLLRYCLDRGMPLPQFCQNISARTIYMLAKSNYIPSVYQGRLTLWRATENLGVGDPLIDDTPAIYKVKDPFLGWGKRSTNGVELYDIYGGHSSMVQEPNVQVMAEKMELYITSVLSDESFSS
ncbi:MAG: amino acid adenylation domain-containing protein [Cyanobacteria bacterium]|nr:amino acid adenylation domain-containing protein [Cyanobacteria bacterium GSL.Bin21]